MTAPAELPAAAYRIPPLRTRRIQRALLYVLLFATLTAAIWFGRDSLLRGAAALWIVSDAVGPADAIVVLGGRPEVRAFAAAEFYRSGLSKKILVANTLPSKLETFGITESHAALNRAVLIKLGVPEAAIDVFGASVSNTHDEAVALRDWVIRTHAHTVIVPTEQFSSRRVSWMLKHVLADTGTQIQIRAFDDPEYSNEGWWKNAKGLLAFQNEVIKHIYYRLRY